MVKLSEGILIVEGVQIDRSVITVRIITATHSRTKIILKAAFSVCWKCQLLLFFLCLFLMSYYLLDMDNLNCVLTFLNCSFFGKSKTILLLTDIRIWIPSRMRYSFVKIERRQTSGTIMEMKLNAHGYVYTGLILWWFLSFHPR